MPVDMFESTFREELGRLTLAPVEGRDERVWKMGFPAWRAIFTGLCLLKHSSGYQLPSFEFYFNTCRRTYTELHPEAERFRHYFEEPLLPGMRQRVWVWYESGMAETYLYVCLVHALEDEMKEGLVLYDARADWKQKADLFVLFRGCQIAINAFWGSPAGRPQVEMSRDETERERKRNTMESAHWENREREGLRFLTIARSASNSYPVNGVRLFTLREVNKLLVQIYALGQEERGFQFPEDPRRVARPGGRRL